MFQLKLKNLANEILAACENELKKLAIEAAKAVAADILQAADKPFTFNIASGLVVTIDPVAATISVNGGPVATISQLSEIIDELHKFLGMNPGSLKLGVPAVVGQVAEAVLGKPDAPAAPVAEKSPLAPPAKA